VYLGFFGTCLGFIWYYEGIREIGPSKAGVFINFVPISAVIMSFFLLGEPVDLSLLVGGALVLSGIYLTNRPVNS
jgi:drug/metabolite transporter (DMT)-like permease